MKENDMKEKTTIDNLGNGGCCGAISQVFALAYIAQRLDRGFSFDPAKKRIVGDDEADALLRGPEPDREWRCYYRI